MSRIRVGIFGIEGKMGSEVRKAAGATDDLEVIGGVDLGLRRDLAGAQRRRRGDDLEGRPRRVAVAGDGPVVQGTGGVLAEGRVGLIGGVPVAGREGRGVVGGGGDQRQDGPGLGVQGDDGALAPGQGVVGGLLDLGLDGQLHGPAPLGVTGDEGLDPGGEQGGVIPVEHGVALLLHAGHGGEGGREVPGHRGVERPVGVDALIVL